MLTFHTTSVVHGLVTSTEHSSLRSPPRPHTPYHSFLSPTRPRAEETEGAGAGGSGAQPPAHARGPGRGGAREKRKAGTVPHCACLPACTLRYPVHGCRPGQDPGVRRRRPADARGAPSPPYARPCGEREGRTERTWCGRYGTTPPGARQKAWRVLRLFACAHVERSGGSSDETSAQ
jgi:hypothetical protein